MHLSMTGHKKSSGLCSEPCCLLGYTANNILHKRKLCDTMSNENKIVGVGNIRHHSGLLENNLCGETLSDMMFDLVHCGLSLKLPLLTLSQRAQIADRSLYETKPLLHTPHAELSLLLSKSLTLSSNPPHLLSEKHDPHFSSSPLSSYLPYLDSISSHHCCL